MGTEYWSAEGCSSLRRLRQGLELGRDVGDVDGVACLLLLPSLSAGCAAGAERLETHGPHGRDGRGPGSVVLRRLRSARTAARTMAMLQTALQVLQVVSPQPTMLLKVQRTISLKIHTCRLEDFSNRLLTFYHEAKPLNVYEVQSSRNRNPWLSSKSMRSSVKDPDRLPLL